MSESSYKEMYYEMLKHCGILADKMQKLELLTQTYAKSIKNQKRSLRIYQEAFERLKAKYATNK